MASTKRKLEIVPPRGAAEASPVGGPRPGDGGWRLTYGELAALDPVDLLQTAASPSRDLILVLRASRLYRLRFVDGALAWACRGEPDDDLARFLVRFRLASAEEIAALKARSAAEDEPLASLLLTAPLAHGEPRRDRWEMLRQYAADVTFDFLLERRGSFVVAEGVVPLPRGLAAAPRELHSATETALGWLVEGGPVDEALVPDAELAWNEGSEDRAALVPLGGLIRRHLVEHPLALADLAQRLPAETYLLRAALQQLLAKDCVRVWRPQQSRPATKLDAGERLRPGRAPKAAERLLLTHPERSLLEAAGQRPLDLVEAGRLVDASNGTVSSLVGGLLDEGLLAVGAAAEQPSRHRWVRAAALGLVVGVLLILAGAAGRFRSSRSDERPTAGSGPTPAVAAVEPAPSGAARTAAVPSLAPTQPTAAAPSVEEAAGEAASARRATDDRTRQVAALLERAQGAVAAGRFDLAVEILSEAARLDPGRPEVADLMRATEQLAVPAETSPPVTMPTAAPEAADAASPAGPAISGSLSTAQTARLIVNAVPYAAVRINGREIGLTPLQLELPVGQHTIEVVRAGYEVERRIIALTGGQERVEAFLLAPQAEP